MPETTNALEQWIELFADDISYRWGAFAQSSARFSLTLDENS